MTLDAKQIYDKAMRLQVANAPTEQRWHDVRAARRGDMDLVFPDLVSEDWPKPIVANFVDIVARDVAEVIAPLPSVQCSSASMQSDRARQFADKRSKIAQHYIANSRLDVQMQTGADHFVTYGMTVFYIEPDFEMKTPRVCVEEPVGGYVEYDRWGRVKTYTRRVLTDTDELCYQYPEYEDEIRKAGKDRGYPAQRDVELVRYLSEDQISLVLCAQAPVFLADLPNRLGEVPVVIARRPWLDSKEPKGQFDDILWVQMARDTLAKLQLEATQKSVEAPLAVPTDIQELTFGADAILRTANPDKIRRVGMEMSPAAFTESQFLLDEMRQGTRYPGARGGNVDGSIVTGRGVQALMGGFDTQVRTAQAALKSALVDVVRLMFKMDEKMWPNLSKSVRGQVQGTPFQLSYTPSRDIKGDHSADVTYGFASGLDPNRAVVMMLQLRAEKAISRDFFARQLPFDINVNEEMTKVKVEDTREAILQGVFAYVQSIPAMAQQGMDPGEAVQRLTQIVVGLQKGQAIEDVVSAAFAPQPPPQAPTGPPGLGEQMGGGPPGMMGGDNLGGGLMESGLMKGVAPGLAGTAPGSRPDLNVMLAGLTGSGKATMSARTERRRRI